VVRKTTAGLTATVVQLCAALLTAFVLAADATATASAAILRAAARIWRSGAAKKRAASRWAVHRNTFADVHTHPEHHSAVYVGLRPFGKSQQEEFRARRADSQRRHADTLDYYRRHDYERDRRYNERLLMVGLGGLAMERIEWQISVPIFKNTLILKQLGLAVGIPFGLVALVIALASGRSVYALYGLGMIAALLFFTWLFLMAVYKGKYEAEFVLDDKGALCRTQAKQAKKNRVINALTVILGLLTGRPAVAGAGMLAQSRQEIILRWNRVTKVRYKPRSRTILLRGGSTENIALFCTEDNYVLVEREVMRRTEHPAKDV
jgi:hypothetical protein